MENLAALCAAVFSLSAKNLTGGLKSTPPPVRGLMSCIIKQIAVYNSHVRLQFRYLGNRSALTLTPFPWASTVTNGSAKAESQLSG